MNYVKIATVAVLGLFFISSDVFAQKTPQYVGSSKCKACHMSKSKGAQYKIWQGSAHAKALETLGTPAAKEIAAKAGVTGNPQESADCLVCHQTGYGVDATKLAKTFKPNSVGCESCHGPGSLYRVASVMNAKKYKADPEGMLAQWKKLGLIIPDEKTCAQCHNKKSPTYKEFDFEEYFKKIAHPNPKIKK